MAKPISYQVVKGARDLIADPQHWCRLTSALDSAGRKVNELNDDAVQFCAGGALTRAAVRLVADDHLQGSKLASQCLNDLGGASRVVVTNDQHGHQAVLDLFDRYLASVDEKVEA